MKKQIIMWGIILSCCVPIAYAETLYTTTTCSECVKAKQYLRNSCIKYNEINITRNNPYGISVVPVLDTKQGRLMGSYAIKQYASEHNKCR